MLRQLSIRHYVIIDQLELTFAEGMTTITGETGAGKSIIIDALELVLGKRADNRCIAINQAQCDLNALFAIEHIQTARTWLADYGLTDPDNPTYCVLRRCIQRDNPSRAYINGQLVTLTQLRDFSRLLVHIHGQHEHQQLVKPAQQCQLLDRFGQHADLVKQVHTQYQTWLTARRELDQVLAKAGDNAEDKKAYLKYQIDELLALSIKPNEASQLEKTVKQLAQQTQVNDNVQLAISQLAEQEPLPVLTILTNLQQQLRPYGDLHGELHTVSQLLEQAYIHAQEAYDSLQDFAAKQLQQPHQQQQLETRLSTIYELARKHRVEPDELPTVLTQLENDLSSLTHIDETVAKLNQQIELALVDYQRVASTLSTARAQAAKQFNQQITTYMQQLGMQGGEFRVQLHPHDTPHAAGLEQCEFTVSANPGQPLQPLAKVASGGELSRISLAIQLITAAQDDAATLLFDEVDVGIGGATAAIVGQLLQQLSQQAQVICITHLPQVAAMGHQQLCVQKDRKQQHTHSHIRLLTEAERIAEIARMLGGLSITAQTRAHAIELLQQANQVESETTC